MIPKDEMKEMNETLSEVAKLKLQFDLLKQVIRNSLDLNYSGDGLRIANDSLIIEVMELIDGREMSIAQSSLMSKHKKIQKAEAEKMTETKEADNG